MARREKDFYPTPQWATDVLLQYTQPHGFILEPCAGNGAISDVLARKCSVVTNDIDPKHNTTYTEDVSDTEGWTRLPRADWVITNPPFSDSYEIARLSYEHAKWGSAMLLRLTFLEPCLRRASWLQKRPPSKIIVLPRISFTGDGKTDSVTCAWFVWEKWNPNQRIYIHPR